MMENEKLPQEFIHKITNPLAQFLKIHSAVGAVLLFSTMVSVILANSSWSEPFLGFWELKTGFHIGNFRVSYSLKHWINDGLMTLFFFVIALEMKRELVLGELRSLRKAALPLAGALGGMLFPVSFYLLIMRGLPEAHGWGIVMATDTAFVIGCLALLGSRIPSSLRIFLLSLAIFDDIGAILVVVFGYGGALNWPALAVGILGIGIIGVVARIGARSVPMYSFLGFMVWISIAFSGIHPTLVGVILGLMTPTMGWVSDERLRSILGKVLSYPPGEHWSGDTVDRRDLRTASTAAREALSPVERLEMRLHPWVGFVVIPLFALANAGVVFSQGMLNQPVAWAITIGLVCGKPMGVFIMSWLAVKLGFARMFSNLSWSFIAAGSILTGIGFTMSLFIAELALSPSSLAPAKFGIFAASVISAILGTGALFWLVYRQHDNMKY